MVDDLIWIDFTTIERFMGDVLEGLGVSEEDAKICSEVLIASDKKGIDSHGINRLKPTYYDRLKAGLQSPVTKVEIVREGPTTALVDGNNGMGHVIAKKAMSICIEKARKFGMGMVAVKNSTHYGIAGYYAEMASKAGMIGITGTNARPSVAPTFGSENMLGTNPLCIGFPTDEGFPFILDCATSITQRGKIEVYARIGKEVPEGLVIDSEGKFMTDADTQIPHPRRSLFPSSRRSGPGNRWIQGLRILNRRRSSLSGPPRRRLLESDNRRQSRPLLYRDRCLGVHRSRVLQEDCWGYTQSSKRI